MIKKNRTNREIINIIVSHNSEEYNLLKLAEECTELSEVLIKMVTKPNRREEKIPHLIEELGDVKLRLDVLITKLDLDKKVTERYNSKLDYLNTLVIGQDYTNY